MNQVARTSTAIETRELINAYLEAYCQQQIRHAAAGHGSAYATMWRFTSSLLLAGGKRLRSHMLVMAYQAYTTQPTLDTILPAAISQELLHVAMLIHDDLIDRDMIRYGVRNVMGQYEDFYATFIDDEQERVHMARSSTLLAGDVLLSEAYRLLGQVPVQKEYLARALDSMSQAVFDVIGGELLDTEAAFMADPLVTAKRIALHKTASYSFVAPMTIGAVLAHAPQSELEKLHTVAEQLGVAYQLRDDMLGIFGDEAQTGKSSDSDITEGKRTYLIEQFEQLASPQQKETFFGIFHDPAASPAAIAQARELLIAAGARAAVENEIAGTAKKITGQIDALAIDDAHKRAFHDLVAQCLSRDS